jgi:hypothetical protein
MFVFLFFWRIRRRKVIYLPAMGWWLSPTGYFLFLLSEHEVFLVILKEKEKYKEFFFLE